MKNNTFVSENSCFFRKICINISIFHMFYNLIAIYEINRFSMEWEFETIIDNEDSIPDSSRHCNSIEVEKLIITFNVHSPCTAVAKSDKIKYGRSATATVVQDVHLFLLYAKRQAPVVQFLQQNT